jgi:hypothetical protein
MSSGQIVRKGARGARRWLARRWRSLTAGVAGLVGFLATAYFVLKLAPDWFAETENLGPKGRADARQGVRTASLALLAGTIAVVGAVYTARSFALNRAGQLTDRFTKAIEQLGNKELDVRLGGIYALERIARDSKDDHPQVVEVLTAYVREHAPMRRPAPSDAGPRESEEVSAQSADLTSSEFAMTATDVQAVLTVLGRRKLAHEQDSPPPLDLSWTYLARARLARANFSGARFSVADLSRAMIFDANFSGAWFSRAKLLDTILSGTNLSAAVMFQAKLANAHLRRANLSYARLVKADLRRANLTEANLREADLSEAELGGANFTRADLTGAKLDGAGHDGDTTWPEGFDPGAAGARDRDRQ